MKRIYGSVASATLLIWSLSMAHAAPTAPDEAQKTIQEVDTLAANVSDAAYELKEKAFNHLGTDVLASGLTKVKTDVNRIVTDLRALDAERAVLSDWEVQALDQIEPLMNTIASDTATAIITFNTERDHLWASPYVDTTAAISKNAADVAAKLREYVKLANAQQKEQQLKYQLGEAASH